MALTAAAVLVADMLVAVVLVAVVVVSVVLALLAVLALVSVLEALDVALPDAALVDVALPEADEEDEPVSLLLVRLPEADTEPDVESDADPVSLPLDEVVVWLIVPTPPGAANATGTAMARASAPAKIARSALPTLPLNVFQI